MSKPIVDSDSDFTDDDTYSGDEGYIDLVRTGPSAIHGSKTKPYTTGVSLGYVDEPEDKATTTYRDSRLGGYPVWLPDSTGKEVRPPAELLQCGVCGRKLALLVQVYAPLEETDYERVVYVMVCRNTGCRRQKGSVRAVRAVKRDWEAEAAAKKQRDLEEQEKARKEKEEADKKKQTAAQMDLFGGAAASAGNPFGGAGSNPFAAAANPFDKKPPVDITTPKQAADSTAPSSAKPSFAEVAKAAPPPASSAPKAAAAPIASAAEDKEPAPAFSDSFYLYVETEELDPMFHKRSLPAGLNPQDLVNLTIDTDDLEGTPDTAGSSSNNNSSKLEAAAAELAAATPGGDDPSFQKFVDTVSQNPTQVVRYDPSGSFLPYSSRDAVHATLTSAGGIPAHPLTREPRRVELQVMPQAITVLEESDLAAVGTDEAALRQALAAGMEWGTIFVGTPVVDTMPGVEAAESGVAYCEEWVGVQYEQ